MGHDTHLVQGRLSVEKHYVAIHELPLDGPSQLYLLSKFFFIGLRYPDTPSVLAYHVIRTRVNFAAPEYVHTQQLYVPACDLFGYRHLVGYLKGYANLVDTKVRFGGNNGTCREVDTLT